MNRTRYAVDAVDAVVSQSWNGTSGHGMTLNTDRGGVGAVGIAVATKAASDKRHHATHATHGTTSPYYISAPCEIQARQFTGMEVGS